VGFVSPRTLNVAAALAATAQVPALSVRVTVTVWAAAAAVAEQLVKPETSVIVGVAGTVKPGLRTAVIVSPFRSAPVELAVNPTVQAVTELAVVRAPVKVTALGGVAAAIVTVEPGLTAAESALVLTLKVFAAYVATVGFVSPTTVKEAAALAATAQVPALSASVTVTVWAAAVAVAEQLVNPAPRTMVGVAGTVKPGLRTAVIVSPAASEPPEPAVKPSVQVERALAVCGEPAKERAEGAVAAAITIAAPGLTALVLSAEVWTLKVLAA
jgi:hypothetical protein